MGVGQWSSVEIVSSSLYTAIPFSIFLAGRSYPIRGSDKQWNIVLGRYSKSTTIVEGARVEFSLVV